MVFFRFMPFTILFCYVKVPFNEPFVMLLKWNMKLNIVLNMLKEIWDLHFVSYHYSTDDLKILGLKSYLLCLKVDFLM